MAAIFYRGSESKRDYTPTAAVAAGDVIEISSQLYVAHLDIAANQLGALACPAGMTAYKIDLDPAYVVADGAAVNVDPADGVAKAAGSFFGYAEGAADGTAGDTHVIVRHSVKAAA